MAKNLLTQDTALVGRLELIGVGVPGALPPNGSQLISGDDPPVSGLLGRPLRPEPGSLYLYTGGANPVLFWNEGTRLSPYWTPVGFDQVGLLGVYEDFRGPDPKGIADVTAALNAASGMRVFGQGVVEVDSGVLKGTDVAGSHVGEMRTTDEDEHVVALGLGSAVAMLVPEDHGTLVIDITWAQLTDILTRRLFVGFAGEAADALDPLISIATTVITFVAAGTEGDDMAGICMDANAGDPDALYLAHVKANAAATIATTATGVDLSTNLAVAATYQRFRLEVTQAGVITAFIDKVQVSRITAALTPATALLPVAALMVESGTTILKATVKQYMAWGLR